MASRKPRLAVPARGAHVSGVSMAGRQLGGRQPLTSGRARRGATPFEECGCQRAAAASAIPMAMPALRPLRLPKAISRRVDTASVDASAVKVTMSDKNATSAATPVAKNCHLRLSSSAAVAADIATNVAACPNTAVRCASAMNWNPIGNNCTTATAIAARTRSPVPRTIIQ